MVWRARWCIVRVSIEDKVSYGGGNSVHREIELRLDGLGDNMRWFGEENMMGR